MAHNWKGAQKIEDLNTIFVHKWFRSGLVIHAMSRAESIKGSEYQLELGRREPARRASPQSEEADYDQIMHVFDTMSDVLMYRNNFYSGNFLCCKTG